MKTQRQFAVRVLSALFGFSSMAADLYVTTADYYETDDAVRHMQGESNVFTNLQDAINSAKTDDTVWVENGYLCDAGATNKTGWSRVYAETRITVRSRSGRWETGATIRGRFHSPETPRGDDAVRCLSLGNNKPSFIGLVFEKGATATGSGDSAFGGGVRGVGVFSNCMFRGNYAGYGGGISGGGPFDDSTLHDCIVSNNAASGYAGGAMGVKAFSSRFIFNTCTLGAGMRCSGRTVVSNCVIACNNGNGIYTENSSTITNFIDCEIAGNTGSGYYGYGNKSGNAIFYKCRFYGNITAMIRSATTNTGLYAEIRDCAIFNNTNSSICGIHFVRAFNCVITNNYNGNGVAGCAGAGNSICYNTLIAANGSRNIGGAMDSLLVNCTVTGNSSGATKCGGCTNVTAINTVSWGNGGKPDVFTAATNSCSAALADPAFGSGNTSLNPKLAVDGPLKYMPLPGSSCRNTGLNFDWMTDPADIRSRDISGRRRICGIRVDIGAFETPFFGTYIGIR